MLMPCDMGDFKGLQRFTSFSKYTASVAVSVFVFDTDMIHWSTRKAYFLVARWPTDANASIELAVAFPFVVVAAIFPFLEIHIVG